MFLFRSPKRDIKSRIDQSKVHMTIWGEGGETIVLVHGSAQGNSVGGDRHFFKQRELADKGWRLIVPDRPGHAQSASQGPEVARELGVWVASLLGEGAHLVGHSFGGLIALVAAAHRPQVTRSLTLIEPALQALATKNPDVGRFLRERIKIILTLRNRPAELARNFSQAAGIPPDLREGGRDASELERVGRGLMQMKFPSKRELRAMTEWVHQANILCLVVSGGWNPAFEATCDEVARLLEARRLVIPTPHHFPNLTDSFNEAFETFLREAV